MVTHRAKRTCQGPLGPTRELESGRAAGQARVVPVQAWASHAADCHACKLSSWNRGVLSQEKGAAGPHGQTSPLPLSLASAAAASAAWDARQSHGPEP